MTGYEQRFYETFPSLIRATEDNAKTNGEILKELKSLNEHLNKLIEVIEYGKR